MNKIEARKLFKVEIKLITSEESKNRRDELVSLLSNLDSFKNAQKVGLYYPLKYELDLTILMELYPKKKYYFPRVIKDSLNFYLVNDLSELKPSLFSLKEPLEGTILERDIDLYLVPCLLTSGNYRIGHGAGFYDKYFAKYDGFKVGIVQKRFKNLEIENHDHDIPMDVILWQQLS